MVGLQRQFTRQPRVCVESADFFKADPLIKRRVPGHITKGCERYSRKPRISCVNKASAQQTSPDAHLLTVWMDVEFPDVKLAAKRLIDKKTRHPFTDMRDQAVPLADKSLQFFDGYRVRSGKASQTLDLLEQLASSPFNRRHSLGVLRTSKS